MLCFFLCDNDDWVSYLVSPPGSGQPEETKCVSLHVTQRLPLPRDSHQPRPATSDLWKILLGLRNSASILPHNELRTHCAAMTPNSVTFQFTFPSCSRLERVCSQGRQSVGNLTRCLQLWQNPRSSSCSVLSYFCLGFFPLQIRAPSSMAGLAGAPAARAWEEMLPGSLCLFFLPLQARPWGVNRSSCGAQVG